MNTSVWPPMLKRTYNVRTQLKSFSFQVLEISTGKSFSEVLILASTNPKYDKRLSSELPVQYMKIPSSEHGENMSRTCCLHKLF